MFIKAFGIWCSPKQIGLKTNAILEPAGLRSMHRRDPVIKHGQLVNPMGIYCK